MNLIQQFDKRWERLVDKAYIQNEEFDYKKVKKLSKDIQTFYDDLLRKKKETITTLNLVEFNDNQDLKHQFEAFIDYAEDMLTFLDNIVNLDPKSKKGYYNYLKNMIGFL